MTVRGKAVLNAAFKMVCTALRFDTFDALLEFEK
jgi:hypothetical protein